MEGLYHVDQKIIYITLHHDAKKYQGEYLIENHLSMLTILCIARPWPYLGVTSITEKKNRVYFLKNMNNKAKIHIYLFKILGPDFCHSNESTEFF